MTLDDLKKMVGFRLGDRADMDERVDLELPYVQSIVLEGKPWFPWFLESEIANAMTEAGEQRVPLPQDFLGEIEESHLYILPPNGGRSVKLQKKDPDTARDMFSDPDVQGFPRAYSIQGLYFLFTPVPDDIYSISMRYYARDVSMVDPLLTPTSRWLQYASDVVLAELCYLLASKHIKDPEAAGNFQADAAAAWKRLLDIHTARMELNQSRSLGGNT